MRDYNYQKDFQKKRRISWPIRLSLLIFLLCGLFIGLFHLIFNTRFFEVSTIEINPETIISSDKLLGLIERELIGSSKILALLGPDNTLFWEFAKISKTNFIPAFSSVEINSDIFSKKISISSTPRSLFGIWCSYDKCFGFDKDGIIFSEAPDAVGSLILKISDENKRIMSPGSKIFADKDWMKNILDIIKILKDNNLAIASVRIRGSSLEEWEVGLNSGPKFYFSLNFVPENFADVIERLDKKLSLKKLAYIDFRIPSRIYYR